MSAPQTDEMAAKCLWCEGYYTNVDADGLCDMCREPATVVEPMFDTSEIKERLSEIDARFLEPLIKKAADNFYCQVLDTVDGYLLENLDYNMTSHNKMLERENQRMRTELWEVDRALGGAPLGPESRINSIKQNQREFNKATDECWRLRAELASAMSAFGQDAEERLEAKPASAVPKADAQDPSQGPSA